MELIEKLMEEYGSDTDTLGQIVSIANGYNGDLEQFEYHENDESFFDTFFDSKDSLARAISYGEYKYMDEYVTFNGYGNLKSMSKWEVYEILEENAEEILQWVIDFPQEQGVIDLDDFEDEDSEEDEE